MITNFIASNGIKSTSTNSNGFEKYECTNQHKIYYPQNNGNGLPETDTRIIRLRRIGNSPLGFSIRGGWEHGTGIFVSEVHQDSEAEREGLKAGDQILRVNGFIIEQAIHDEVIALIKSSSRITLKVKSVGMIPVKGTRPGSLSWKLVDLPPTCPIHSWSKKNSHRSDLSSEKLDNSNKDILQSYGLSSNDYMEAKVFIRITRGQSLGCSVVKGPSNYPGIFVQSIKDGGIAQESGLEVGDQIIAMNGVSFEPDDIEFNVAISKIKSCNQMTLTVRKKSGLSLFQQQRQKMKTIVHPPIYFKHSSESSSTNSSQFFYAPSEHDYSLSEVESNGPAMPYCENKDGKVDLSKGSSIVNAHKIYDKVRKEEERIAEERKKLESEQKRLQDELEKLEKERKQLETRKPPDDIKSISSSSTVSGTQSISSSGSGSQMGFLEEIKKLAERRTDENGLITDTLNKTKNLERIANRGIKGKSVAQEDDENRKRHELLMEEFRAAHLKMFGQNSSNQSKPGDNIDKNTNEIPNANKMQSSNKSALNQVKNPTTETVTILRTTSPAKKLPPPVPPIPKKKSTPLVTISGYGCKEKNRFLINDNKNAAINEEGKNSHLDSNNDKSPTNSNNPISIKINLP